MIRKSAWLLSAGLAVLATPAFAQDAQPATETGKPTTAPPTEGSTSQAAAVQSKAKEQQPVDTGDIVITATRRNQALSDVPMAVSAVTAESCFTTPARLTFASSTRWLRRSTLCLDVLGSGRACRHIRGIGTVGDNPGLESSVGIFVDGVYRSRVGAASRNSGRSTASKCSAVPRARCSGATRRPGLISIITAKPRFTPEVSGNSTSAITILRRLEASITGPVSDTIAVRLDGVWMKRDGFLKDVVSGRRINDRDRWLFRGQILFQPNDNFSFRLIADYTHRDEECCGATYLPVQDVTAAGPQPSTIAAIERGLGAIINDTPFASRRITVRERSYRSDVTD